MEVSVHYRTIRELHDKSLLGTTWDIHPIGELDSVITHVHGYVSVTDVHGQVFIYPLSNLISVRITK